MEKGIHIVYLKKGEQKDVCHRTEFYFT